MKYQYRAVLSFVPSPLPLTFIWNNSKNNRDVLEFSFTLKFSCIFHGMWPRQSSKFNTPTKEFNLDTSAGLKNYSISQSGQKCSADAIGVLVVFLFPSTLHWRFNASTKHIIDNTKTTELSLCKGWLYVRWTVIPDNYGHFCHKNIVCINFWWKKCFTLKT